MVLNLESLLSINTSYCYVDLFPGAIAVAAAGSSQSRFTTTGAVSALLYFFLYIFELTSLSIRNKEFVRR